MIRKWNSRNAYLIRPTIQDGEEAWAVEGGMLSNLRLRMAQLTLQDGEQTFGVKLATESPDSDKWYFLSLSMLEAADVLGSGPAWTRTPV